MMENNITSNNTPLEEEEDIILEVKNLKQYFDITTGFFKTTPLKAVDNVSFKIKRGETLGVVGESGCGKTTLGRTIINLYKPSSGDVIFEGLNISPYSDLKKIKKEKSFELKSLKYEKNKKIKLKKKELDDLEKKELEENLDVSRDYQKDLDEFISKTNEQYLIDKDNLIKEYDQKYLDKEEEINKAINKAVKAKENALAKLEIVTKESDLESISKVDLELAKLKEEYDEIILKAKEERNNGIILAKQNKIKRQAAFNKMKEDYNALEKKLSLELKTSNDEAKEKELNAIKKDHLNDILVTKEKNKGAYKVDLSIAKSKFQTAKAKALKDLKKKEYDARRDSKYYSYLDDKEDIIDTCNRSVKRIKSSSRERMKKFRKNCAMVFQDPYSSLNPRMTVQDIIAEPLDVNHLYSTEEERRSKVLHLMKLVGLSPEQSTRYAHEFSGGQRQRIGIARSLAVNPKFIICDEPVSALDVSIQAQVINTFADLQKKLGLTYLFIAHDLLVVRHISNRIAVMYLGKIVEIAETNELFDNPMHPYTTSLLSAVPMPDPNMARENKRIILEGDVPSPLNVPQGCPFHTRCPKAKDICSINVPKLKEIIKGHFVSCLLYDEKEEESVKETIEETLDSNIENNDTNEAINND